MVLRQNCERETFKLTLVLRWAEVRRLRSSTEWRSRSKSWSSRRKRSTRCRPGCRCCPLRCQLWRRCSSEWCRWRTWGRWQTCRRRHLGRWGRLASTWLGTFLKWSSRWTDRQEGTKQYSKSAKLLLKSTLWSFFTESYISRMSVCT